MANNRPASKEASASTRIFSKSSVDALLFAKLSDKEMKRAVKKTGPKVYQITDIKESEARFITFGCQGAGNDDQKQVAKLIDKIKAEVDPHFYLILGDNVYDWGASSPTDQTFKQLFDDFYCTFNPKVRTPGAFVILGNHDGNYQAYMNRARSSNPTGQKTEKNEVAHTFRNQYHIDIFSKTSMPYNIVPSWSMPYYFYGIDVGENLRIFCLNSNSFLKDFHDLFHLLDLAIPDKPDMHNIFRSVFLNKINNTEFDSNHPAWRNQAYWTFKNYHEAIQQGKTIYFAQHNPLQTVGKRSDPANFDSKYYETKEERENIKLITGLKSYSQCKLLNAAYRFLGFNDIQLLLAAHDHNINLSNFHSNNLTLNTTPTYSSTKLSCQHQFVSGGGGGKLEGIETFRHHHDLLCHLKQHGIGVMNIDLNNPKKFYLDIYTTRGLHLRYDAEQSCFSQKPIADHQLKALAECVSHATEEYFEQKRLDELKKSQKDENVDNDTYISSAAWATNAIWKKVKKSDDEATEIEVAQNLSAYFLQYKLNDFKSAKQHLLNSIHNLFHSYPESRVISIIQKELATKEDQLRKTLGTDDLKDYQDFFRLQSALTVQNVIPMQNGYSY